MIQYVFSANIQFFRYNGHLVDIATTNEQGDVKITMQDVAATLLGDDSIFGRSVHVSDFIAYHARRFIPDFSINLNFVFGFTCTFDSLVIQMNICTYLFVCYVC